jgi:hypothetical protein
MWLRATDSGSTWPRSCVFRGGTEHAGNAGQVFLSMAETAAQFGLQKPSELKKLTGKMPAFVCCPTEALSDHLAQTLPATLTVLEIPGIKEMPPELSALCRQLKAEGFRFALPAAKCAQPGRGGNQSRK